MGTDTNCKNAMEDLNFLKNHIDNYYDFILEKNPPSPFGNFFSL
jgi:hypothetical protein